MTDNNDINKAQSVNAGAPDTKTDDRPGRILGSAKLQIQTRQAQRLVYGRRRTAEKNQIIGMLQFGFFVQKIWSAAAQDDPYADWYLLKIHDALERGRDELAELKKEAEDRLAATSNLKIDIAHSVEPILIPIQFPNPYGYMGAYLIADYDDLTIALLTVRHFGLADRNTVEKQLAKGASIVRRTFMSSAGWKNTGVTRTDFYVKSTAGLQRAKLGVTMMGELPGKVRDETLRSAMAPQISNRGVENFEEMEPISMDEIMAVDLPDNLTAQSARSDSDEAFDQTSPDAAEVAEKPKAPKVTTKKAKADTTAEDAEDSSKKKTTKVAETKKSASKVAA